MKAALNVLLFLLFSLGVVVQMFPVVTGDEIISLRDIHGEEVPAALVKLPIIVAAILSGLTLAAIFLTSKRSGGGQREEA